MSRVTQSCLIGMIAVLVTVQVCLGKSETKSHMQKSAPVEITSSVPARDASLTGDDKEALKATIMAMIRALNTFDFDEFTGFFSADALKMLKHQVQHYSTSHLFELIFSEGRAKANELTPEQFFARIIAKSKFNVGVSRPYEINMLPGFQMRADDDGEIATVITTFPESYSGYQTRSETFTFRKVDNQWIAEIPDFILSDFKYDLTGHFAIQRNFYPLYPVMDTFRVMMKAFPQWQ